jgi:hypothetical protein
MSITFNLSQDEDKKNNLEPSNTSKLFNKENQDIYFDDYFVDSKKDKTYIDPKNINREDEISFDDYDYEETEEKKEATRLRRFNYGRKQEQTVLGNLYQMGKAALVQNRTAGETWSQALQKVEKQRQVEIFEEYPEMQGREEDGYVLTGRLHDAILDPVYLAIPWARIAQANRLASVGLSAAVGGADAMARDLTLYGHVDKTNVAISASLAGVGGAVGDTIANYLTSSRKLNRIGQNTGEEFSTYGLDRQLLLDLGDELVMENTPTVQRIVRNENQVNDLQIKRKALLREKEELLKEYKSIKPNDPDNKKFGEQLDFFGFDSKKQFPNIKAIEDVNSQIKKVNEELNKLRYNQIEDRGNIGIASFIQAYKKGYLRDGTWDSGGKELARALLHETVRPVAYGMSGGVMGLYLANDQDYYNDDETMKEFALYAAAAGFLHKRVINYKGDNLSPTLKTQILNLIKDDVKQEMSFAYRGYFGRYLASSQSAKLAAGSPPLQRFGLKFVRNLGTKLSRDEVIGESVDEMRDVIGNRFKNRLTRIFAEIDEDTRYAVGRLLQNRNMKPNSKYTFLKEGDLENEKARLAYQRYIVLENEFKDYIKDTGLIYRQDDSYGLTQLFAEGELDDKELIETLSKAFKIQYRNNKSKYPDVENIDKWATNQAQSYLNGADPFRRESIITDESLLNLSDSITSPIISKYNNSGKGNAIIRSSRFLDNERVLFDQEARAFAKDIFVQDPFYTTNVLYDSVIPIAEFSKEFGPNGERLRFVRDEIKKHYQELLPKGQVLTKGNTAYPVYKDELKEVANTINAYFKVYDGHSFGAGNETLRSFMYTLQTITSVKGLTKVAIPNLGDIMQTIQNSGYRSAWESIIRQLKENSLNKGINMVKPSSVLNTIDRFDRPRILQFWKNAKYGKNGTMEAVLQDTTQNIKSKNTFQENLHLFQRAFFELNQLGRVTRFAREFAYDTGAFKAYSLSRKLVTKGKLSRSERRELSYLGIDKEAAKIIGKYKNMDDAWNSTFTNKFIEKAGQRSADRDASIPQVGNRLLFSQSNNPFIRAAGTFLSWAQSKATQTSALLARVEDGDAKLALRAASLLPIYFAVRQLALAASSSKEYRERESVEMYFTDDGFIDIFEANDFKSFTKEMGDTLRFTGQLIPWWADKLVNEYGRENPRQGEISGFIPVASTFVDLSTSLPFILASIPGATLDTLGIDLFGIGLSDKFYQSLVKLAEQAPFGKDITRAETGDTLLGIPTDMFVDKTIDASLAEQAKIADEETRTTLFEGGLQIRNAVDNPKNRINPYTGEPYAVTAGVSLLDILERRNLLNITPRMPFRFGKLVQRIDNYLINKTDDIDPSLIGRELKEEDFGLTKESLKEKKAIDSAKFKETKKVLVSQRELKHPSIQEKYKQYEKGKITYKDYHSSVMNDVDDAGQKLYAPAMLDSAPLLNDVLDIFTYVPPIRNKKTNTRMKPIVGVNEVIENGERVGLRLHIPAYINYNKYIVTLHGGKGINPDDARAYSNTGYIKNVMFSSKRKEAKRVHDRLQGKATFGKMFGDWQNHSPEELATMANKFINDPEWVQVGFNPDKFSYFYNKATGNPLKSADEVIQIGALVLAKNVEELPIDDILNKTDVYTRNIDWIKDNLFDNNLLFNEGGEVSKDGNYGDVIVQDYKEELQGLKDMLTDPVGMIDSIGQLGLGAIALAIPDEYQERKLDQYEDLAKKVGQSLVDNFGTLEKAKQTIIDNPVGTAATVSGLLLGGGYGLKRIADATKASKASQAGSKMIKASDAVDPIIGPILGAGKLITRRDFNKGVGVTALASAIPASKVLDEVGKVKTIKKLKGISKFRGIMDNISPYLLGSEKRKKNLETAVKIDGQGRRKRYDIDPMRNYEAIRNVFNRNFPTIGHDSSFALRVRTPKVKNQMEKFQKQYNLQDSDFSIISTHEMNEKFNARLADQRVRTDKKAFESLQETRKQMGKDFTPTFDAQQSVNQIQFISKNLDNAPDKKITIGKVETKDPKQMVYRHGTDNMEHRLTTGTVDGVPVMKVEFYSEFTKGQMTKINEELYIPNESGLEELSKQKNNITKRDMLTGLRDRNNKGGLVNRLQQRNMYG